MPLRILTQPSDMNNIRGLVLAFLSPTRAASLLPDSVISADWTAARAENVVIDYVGSDWSAIVAGSAPPQYAGGDTVAAQGLIRAAAAYYTCVYLTPTLQQLVPTMEMRGHERVQRNIVWADEEANFLHRAWEALDGLTTMPTPPALQLAHPNPDPIDPAYNPYVVAPYGRGRFLPGDWLGWP